MGISSVVNKILEGADIRTVLIKEDFDDETVFTYDPLVFNDATLLSGADIEDYVPKELWKARADWWTKGAPSETNAYYAYKDGSDINKMSSPVDVDKLVRPALYIANNLDDTDYVIGDKFKFAGKIFTVVSNDYAFCDTDIGYWMFDAHSSRYKGSAIQKYIHNWFNSHKNEVPEKI